MSKRVLSFSLWGDKPIYNIGAIKNAYLAKHFYPDFECWYYVCSGLRNYKESLYLNKMLHINPAFTYLSPNILL
jgi:hypothetical protein